MLARGIRSYHRPARLEEAHDLACRRGETVRGRHPPVRRDSERSPTSSTSRPSGSRDFASRRTTSSSVPRPALQDVVDAPEAVDPLGGAAAPGLPRQPPVAHPSLHGHTWWRGGARRVGLRDRRGVAGAQRHLRRGPPAGRGGEPGMRFLRRPDRRSRRRRNPASHRHSGNAPR